jgi:hypothetical protein
MPCHLVGLSGEAQVRVPEELRFRGVMRVHGECAAVGAGGPSLLDARIDCQRGSSRGGNQCLACSRLLAWEPGPNEGELILQCVWTHSDPVSARMTSHDALVLVASRLDCAEAERVAERAGVHRLLIAEEGQLAGIVCRHDLQRTGVGRVSACMQRDVYVIQAAATLGEAAAAMYGLDIGCLPVTREGKLVGIITRGDLIRAGLPADTFTS